MRSTRLFDPNINPDKPHSIKHKRRAMNVPKEGPGPMGSTGFGETPPATGGSMAPPFAPGGPENPYPPSAGMPPPNITTPPGSGAMQPGFMGSGAPGSQGIPGQTGPGGRPGNYPMPTRQPQQYGPQPGAGQMAPQQSGVKPRGVKTIPHPEGKHPPKEPPQPPGQWITVDAGKGQPPAYGFLPHESDESTTDTGLGEEPEKKQQTGQKSGEQKGHYVALQMPKGPGQDKDDEPTWCWIPEIGSDYGLKKEEKESSVKPSPKS